MIFERKPLEYKVLKDWHRWFAWYPVEIGLKTIWLEHVERKIEQSVLWDWDSEPRNYKVYYYRQIGH